jgi:protein required for attachment to host cells
MPELRIGHGEWVVVCDGAKALILENVGGKGQPKLQTREVHEHAAPKTSEQGTDAPGRVQQSASTARSAMEQTDWHDEAERAFLGKLAERLDKAVTAGETKAIFLAASPRALGVLRQAYSQHVRGALRAEVPKDLVKMPVAEIEKHLVG